MIDELRPVNDNVACPPYEFSFIGFFIAICLSLVFGGIALVTCDFILKVISRS